MIVLELSWCVRTYMPHLCQAACGKVLAITLENRDTKQMSLAATRPAPTRQEAEERAGTVPTRGPGVARGRAVLVGAVRRLRCVWVGRTDGACFSGRVRPATPPD